MVHPAKFDHLVYWLFPGKSPKPDTFPGNPIVLAGLY